MDTIPVEVSYTFIATLGGLLYALWGLSQRPDGEPVSLRKLGGSLVAAFIAGISLALLQEKVFSWQVALTVLGSGFGAGAAKAVAKTANDVKNTVLNPPG